MVKSMKYVCLAMAAAVGVSSMASGAITIDLVPVGNAGNTADTATGNHGAVAYDYSIGKYEVTATQYTAFLNAIAATDTNGVYKSDMANTNGSGITRSGSSGSYVYTVDVAHQNRPVTHMTLWSALRFVNWMENGQPTGVQGNATTEQGSYDLTNGVFDPLSPNYRSTPRTVGAKWVLPTVDEAYKAAYYHAGGSGSYFYQPFDAGTAGDITAGSDTSEATNTGRNANFKTGSNYVDSTYGTTPVGQFSSSDSYYGTFDQGGNLQEWVTRTDTPTFHSLVGGHFGNEYYGMWKTDALWGTDLTAGNASYGGGAQGFRLAYVPEPGSLMLLGFGAAGLLVRRRRAGAAM